MKNCLVILLLLISFNCISQQRCHTAEYEENLKNKYSQYKEERKKVNKETNHWIENNYQGFQLMVLYQLRQLNEKHNRYH